MSFRVDANGAFSPYEIEEKLLQLKDLDVHSIEQPIQSGQLEKLAYLCKKNILPLALDEELIGISPKFTSVVVRLYLGPRRVTLPLVALTLIDSPFWSERTISDINKL